MTSYRQLTNLDPAEVGSVLDGLAEPAMLIAPDHTIRSANSAFEHSFGDLCEVLGQKCFEVSHCSDHPCDHAGESCPLEHCRRTGRPHRVFHVHMTDHGEEHHDVRIYPVCDSRGRVVGYVEVISPSRLCSASPNASCLVGRSTAFRHMLMLASRVAESEATVLLLGESGTGKEMVAQAIHRQSLRSEGPFVPVDCSGLAESLIESELFGHERGAFTGAHRSHSGLVESARGGTLFLDEVGDIPHPVQTKLLRLLESGTYRSVGSIETRHADFRLVCATHRDLDAMVAEGRFRNDLYYRINTFPITVPPLRERLSDVAVLIPSLLARICPGVSVDVSSDASNALHHYEYPGNVRELRNLLERALLLSENDTILTEHLPPEVANGQGSLPSSHHWPDQVISLAELEDRYLRWVDQQFHLDRRTLADRLGLSERTLFRKLRRAHSS